MSFANTLLTVREEVGDAIYDRIVASLPAETQNVARTPPLGIQWIPIRHLQGLLRSAEGVLGEVKCAEVFGAVGIKMLKRDMSTIYRVLLRVATVDMVVSRAGTIFNQYFKEAGSLVLQRVSEKSLVAHYSALPEATASYGRLMAGAVVGTLSMTGVEHVRIVRVHLRKPGDVDVDIEWQ